MLQVKSIAFVIRVEHLSTYYNEKTIMDSTEIKILQTAITLAIFLFIRILVVRIINRTVRNNILQKTRGKIIKKIFAIGFTLLAIYFISTIWGVDQSELLLYFVSALTVLGIALFAQWSHLSNLTSAIIIFFTHNVRLDDTISIIDRDFEIEGRVSDISFFFIRLRTAEGDEVILPNNIFMQKMIKKHYGKPI